MFQGVQTLTLAPRICTTKAVFTLCAHAHAQNSATFRHGTPNIQVPLGAIVQGGELCAQAQQCAQF